MNQWNLAYFLEIWQGIERPARTPHVTFVVASHNRLQFFLCFHKRVLKGCSLFVRDDWMFWKLVFSKSWLRIRLRCSISICFKFLTARWYVVTKDNLVKERGGGGTGGLSLPLPVPYSLTSRTFTPFYLPTLTLHCVAPVFRLIKRIKTRV